MVIGIGSVVEDAVARRIMVDSMMIGCQSRRMLLSDGVSSVYRDER